MWREVYTGDTSQELEDHLCVDSAETDVVHEKP